MTHLITTVAVIAGAERRIGAIAAVVAQLGFRSCGEHWICAFKPRTRAREQKLIVLLLLMMLLQRPSSFAPDQRGRWNDGVAIKPVWRATESDATFCERSSGGRQTVAGISSEGHKEIGRWSQKVPQKDRKSITNSHEARSTS